MFCGIYIFIIASIYVSKHRVTHVLQLVQRRIRQGDTKTLLCEGGARLVSTKRRIWWDNDTILAIHLMHNVAVQIVHNERIETAQVGEIIVHVVQVLWVISTVMFKNILLTVFK